MQFPPVRRRLRVHFAEPNVTPGRQRAYVGKRPLDDGWVMVIVRIVGRTDAEEATWLGQRIWGDLLAHLRFINQEHVPVEAVSTEIGKLKTEWAVAVSVTLISLEEAARMMDFLTAYASA